MSKLQNDQNYDKTFNYISAQLYLYYRTLKYSGYVIFHLNFPLFKYYSSRSSTHRFLPLTVQNYSRVKTCQYRLNVRRLLQLYGSLSDWNPTESKPVAALHICTTKLKRKPAVLEFSNSSIRLQLNIHQREFFYKVHYTIYAWISRWLCKT